MDRAGRGLALVWRRQIQQLNRVSLETASAVVDAYPSPQLLVQVCHSRAQGSLSIACEFSEPPDFHGQLLRAHKGLTGQQCRSAKIRVANADPGREHRFSCPKPSVEPSMLMEKGSLWMVPYLEVIYHFQAYRQCFSEQERHNLLADIQVRRGEGVTSTSRRVGPELSRRIYLQMTTLQPHLSLDSAD